MSASTVKCYVLGGDVTVVSDLTGNVTNVICPEFFRLSHRCEKKTRELGTGLGLAARAADLLTGSRAIYCEFGNPDDSTIKKATESISDALRTRRP